VEGILQSAKKIWWNRVIPIPIKSIEVLKD